MIEQHIFNTLQALVGGRVYPDVAPANTELPYLVYQQVGGAPINFLDRTVPDKEFAVVQLAAWANTRIAASNLGREVEIALRTAPELKADVETGRASRHDDVTDYYGTMQDFSFFS